MKESINFIGLNDFKSGQRSINLETFGDLSKAITPQEFLNRFPSAEFIHIDSKGINSLVEDIKSKAADLKKGGKKRENILKKGVDFVESLSKVTLSQNGELKEIWVSKRVEKTNDDLQKGNLSNALDYGGISKGSFTKSGKEIKSKLEELVKTIKAKIVELDTERDSLMEEIGEEPTEKLYDHEMGGLLDSCDLKKFPYEKTYSSSSEQKVMITNVNDQEVNPQEAMRNYNRNVSKTVDCMRDVSTAEVFMRNLDEKKKYELNLRELKELNF